MFTRSLLLCGLLAPSVALAGMPFVTLAVKALWNRLSQDVPRLPNDKQQSLQANVLPRLLAGEELADDKGL